MTDAELETRLARAERITELFTRGLSDDGLVPFLALDARLGICTTFWAKKPFGQGATLSIGSAIDRFAAYIEIDEAVCPDHPSVALYASVVCGNPHGQPNIAIEGVAGNAPDRDGVSQNYGLALSLGDRTLILQREGIQLLGDWATVLIGRLGGAIKALWP